eukprot:5812826-Prymnesium_polylepis.1
MGSGWHETLVRIARSITPRRNDARVAAIWPSATPQHTIAAQAQSPASSGRSSLVSGWAWKGARRGATCVPRLPAACEASSASRHALSPSRDGCTAPRAASRRALHAPPPSVVPPPPALLDATSPTSMNVTAGSCGAAGTSGAAGPCTR